MFYYTNIDEGEVSNKIHVINYRMESEGSS